MEMRELGRTGMNVSVLGLGLAEIPRHDYAYSDVEATARVLNNALDNGINFLDTAACYGETEEMMGRTVADRRSEYYLATKAGHVTGGASGEPWTASVIEESIDRSLERLRTDYVDLVQIPHLPDGGAGEGRGDRGPREGQGRRQDPVHRPQRRQRGGDVGRQERPVRHPPDQLQPRGGNTPAPRGCWTPSRPTESGSSSSAPSPTASGARTRASIPTGTSTSTATWR